MRTRKIIFVLLALGLSGCGSRGVRPASEDPVTTNDEVDRLKIDFAAAKENQVDVLAPETFSLADDALRATETHPTHDRVASARTLLKTAVDRAAALHDRMGPALDARSDARDAHAPELAPYLFQSAENRFRELSRTLARAPADERDPGFASVVSAYQQSQAEAHVTDLLRKARETQDQARREDAEKWAPRTWREADMEISTAAAIIRKDPFLTADASIAALKAEKGAEHLLSVTRLSQSLKGRSWEEIALRLEDQDLRLQDFAMKASGRAPAACAPDREKAPLPRGPRSIRTPTDSTPSADPGASTSDERP